MRKNTTDFPQTTTTLVERLSNGGKEEWSEFWRRYESPIKEVLKNKIWNATRNEKGNPEKKDQAPLLDYNDPNAYILAVFQRIQKKFSTYVHHGSTQFRGCIITWISNVIEDELLHGKKWGWKRTELKLDNEIEDGDGQARLVSDTIQCGESRRVWSKELYDDNNEERCIMLELCRAILAEAKKQAANRFPWRGERKEIVKLLATTDLSVSEIAERCNTEPYNVSKVKAAFEKKIEEVYLAKYKSDDYEYWDSLISQFRLSGLNITEAERVIAAQLTQIDSMSKK